MGDMDDPPTQIIVGHIICFYIVFCLTYPITGVVISILYWEWVCDDDDNGFLFLSTWLLIKTIFGVIFIFVIPLIAYIIDKKKLLKNHKSLKCLFSSYSITYLILYCLFVYTWAIIGFILLFKYYYDCLNELISIVCFIYIFLSLMVPCITYLYLHVIC